MRISSFTIQSLIDRIPRHLVGRYSTPNFPITVFNELSSDLEKDASIKYLKSYFILPMEEQVNRYKIASVIRNIRGVYLLPRSYSEVVPLSTSNLVIEQVNPDKMHPLRFDVHGDTLEIDALPSSIDPIIVEERTVVNSTGSTTKKLFDVDVNGPLASESSLRGMGIIINHSNGVQEHFIVASSDGDEYSLRVNGEMSAVPDNQTIYSMYRNFFVLEIVNYLPTLTEGTNNTQLIQVPADFEAAYRWGMFWKYFAQEGENRSEIDRYENLYNKEKNRLMKDQNKVRGDNRVTRPRQIPNMF